MEWEATKSSGPDISYLFHRSFFLEGRFKEALVDRFLTRVSGQWKVGEKGEGSHGRTNKSGLKYLVVMHEIGELWVGIREIDLLIFNEMEVFHISRWGFLAYFSLSQSQVSLAVFAFT